MKVIEQWNWWRHNHSMSWWKSLRLTFHCIIIYPLREVYSWLWLKTKGKYILRKCKKLEKEIK